MTPTDLSPFALNFLSIVLVILLVSLLAGLIRILKGRSPADRMLTAQLMGTTAVAMLAILSQVMAMPALLNVALVFALLAAITLIVFVTLAARRAS